MAEQVSYAAAFCASTFSTLIMHPADTIKTRLMVKGRAAADDEWDGRSSGGGGAGGGDGGGARVVDECGPLVGDILREGLVQGDGSGDDGQGDMGGRGRLQIAVQEEVKVAGAPPCLDKGAHRAELSPALGLGALGSASALVGEGVGAMGGGGGGGGGGDGSGDGKVSEGALAQLSSVYEGVIPNIFKEAPASAVYLGVYEWARAVLSLSFIGATLTPSSKP